MTKIETITSRSNPMIKSARSLKNKKERQQTGKFLVEGIYHVGEVIEAGWLIDTVFFAPELLESDFGMRIVREESEKGIRCVAVNAEIMESLAEKENPQGIIAVVNQRLSSLDSLSPHNFKTGMALVLPQDPGNVGTILRTLDAVGADGLFLLDGGVEPFHPSVVRASMGTVFWKSLVACSFDEFITWTRDHQYRLIGTSAHAKVDYRDVSIGNTPTIILLGSEQKGLTQPQIEACDITISLPMHGRTSSLNLAVAAGVLLYNLIETSKTKSG